MNLLEVKRSDRLFKRKDWEIWFKEILNYNLSIVIEDSKGSTHFLSKEDILAEDWMVKEDE